ncbi:MAG: DUF2461 domain-containing protein [Chloroflexi bacterium]|nr:MAG: DUF2461 domain-containing protein [Chloroflexota bacterium]
MAAARTGNKLAGIVEALRATDYELDQPELKRIPAPYPQDHPRGQLLRHKRLIYWRRWPVGRWIASREALERVRTTWRDGMDLKRWFDQNVGESAYSKRISE